MRYSLASEYRARAKSRMQMRLFYALTCLGLPRTSCRSIEELIPVLGKGIIGVRLQVHRAQPKSHALAWLFYRLLVPWIVKNKLVDQSKD
jgi:hypothetical protein